ncbi:non-heme iron oxygenase ferredoxin subunit [Kordiimonas gwangyangensis]|uniref:non-heme iron oxygenase ferredoxin subunit n=1 Tax=Kordiimonas gwangyangensis TaxID=288022 RepID=UPI00192E738C|nr:non-heme iron oxygenase ferredoxin subunit [Kordiimonas gwangyangensis]
MRMKVCALDDLDIGGAIKLDVQPPVAVIRGESGDVFAIDDTCTHADASLSEGFVEGDAVECPLHMAFFCLKSGQPSCPPATVPVKPIGLS